jgi:hypothetical protein
MADPEPKRRPLTDDWAVPPPPPGALPPRPAVRGVRVSIGIVIAVAGHLLTVVAFYAGSAMAGGDWPDTTGRSVLLWGELLLAAACLVVGPVLAVRRRDGGIGIGLIIGWAACVPVVAYEFAGEWLFSRIEG